MPQTVVGLFDDRDAAQAAIKDFLKSDFPSDRISIITSDPKGEFVQQKIDHEGGTKSGEGAMAGAATGAVAGGIFGLLVGVGVLVFPAVGLVAAGPVAAMLAGAGVGALGGGLLGALIGLGIPQDHADTYAEAIRRGGCLVSMEVDEAQVFKANEIMKRHGAVDVHQRAQYFQQQGARYDPKARAFTAEEAERERMQWRAYASQKAAADREVIGVPSTTGQVAQASQTQGSVSPDQAAFSQPGLTYEQWEPAYKFGWLAAQSPNCPSFDQCEANLRMQWEQTNPGTFEMYRPAIASGFDDAYSRRSGARML